MLGGAEPAAWNTAETSATTTRNGTNRATPSPASIHQFCRVQPMAPRGSPFRHRKKRIRATRPRSRRMVEIARTVKPYDACSNAKIDRTIEGTIRNRNTATSTIC